jgi:hypothetical protein
MLSPKAGLVLLLHHQGGQLQHLPSHKFKMLSNRTSTIGYAWQA